MLDSSISNFKVTSEVRKCENRELEVSKYLLIVIVVEQNKTMANLILSNNIDLVLYTTQLPIVSKQETFLLLDNKLLTLKHFAVAESTISNNSNNLSSNTNSFLI